MKIVDDVFKKLNNKNRKLSAYDYSTDWLKKSKGYYAYLKSSGEDAGYDAVIGLYGEALKRHNHWSRYIEKNKDKHEVSHMLSITALYEEIADSVLDSIRKTAIKM